MKKIRTVLVGCGGISRSWLNAVRNNFADNIDLVGFVDLNPEAARNRADEFEVDDVWIGDDLAEAIDTLKPDAVFNCTIPAAHYALSKLALEKGCHVLIEKPLTETVEQAKELIALAEEKQRVFSVIQNRRYHGAIQKVVRVLSSGVLGRLNTLNVDFYMAMHWKGFRAEMKHLLLMDMAIHTFDQARFMSGQNPTSVFCYDYNPHGSTVSHGSAAMAIFEMTDDVMFNYRGSWMAEGFKTSWYGTWRVIGDKGTLIWDGLEDIQVETTEDFAPDARASSHMRSIYPVGKASSSQTEHAGVIGDFIDAVQNGGSPLTAASDNIYSLAMVESACLSAETGKRIEIKI